MYALMAAVLLVFYLYLLIKFENVKRPTFYLIGIGSLVVSMFFIGIFEPWSHETWAKVLIAIMGTIFSLVAFVAGVVACYRGKLPVELAEPLETE